jgi:hypothetical protein
MAHPRQFHMAKLFKLYPQSQPTMPGAVNWEFKSTSPRWMLRLPVTETGEVKIPVDFARQGVRFMAKIVKIVYKLPSCTRIQTRAN